MNKYRISAGNPEGITWFIDFYHEKLFTQEEFDDISEQAIVYALEEEYKRDTNHSYISSINTRFVIKFMQEKGFITVDKKSTCYHFEPYWSGEYIKSKKLLQWIVRKDIEGLPEYMQ